MNSNAIAEGQEFEAEQGQGQGRLSFLYDTSWTMHRVSPLHHAMERPVLPPPRSRRGHEKGTTRGGGVREREAPQFYANRLREALHGFYPAGSVVFGGEEEGIEREHENDGLAKAGRLKECRWERRRGVFDSAGEEDGIDDDDNDDEEDTSRAGVLVSLVYENVVYKAFLLPGRLPRSSTPPPSTTTHLPLLLTRLPTPLRSILISFLANTFDTYISPLRLPSQWLSFAIERYIGDISSGIRRRGRRPRGGSTNDNESEDELVMAATRNILREMQITITFRKDVVGNGLLRNMDVWLPRQTVVDFLSLSRGNRHRDNSNNNSNSDDNDDDNYDNYRTAGTFGRRFTTALERYFDQHLAMRLHLSSALSSSTANIDRISKIVCGAFILGCDGRVKFFTPGGDEDMKRATAQANDGLLSSLAQKAGFVESTAP